MRDKIRKMVTSDDKEMRELGIRLLITNYIPEEWPNIIPTTRSPLAIHVDTVYFLKDWILVVYDPVLTSLVRLTAATDKMIEIYSHYANDRETYKIIRI